jgi:hypothetical protein
MSAGGRHDEAETAVAVAERGLAAWREAKAAWLQAVAGFGTQETVSIEAADAAPA